MNKVFEFAMRKIFLKKDFNVIWQRFGTLLLCLALFVGNVMDVRASEDGDAVIVQHSYLELSTAEEFLSFAEKCRIDQYSQNMQVFLTGDIDLKEVSFEGVPIFTGTFDGRGHKITGLHVDGEGSVKGLFRYLTDTARVENLTVEGVVNPSGSRSDVGGIAGNNAGAIINCKFSGTVSGGDNVGGIAGINEMSGIIEKCHVDGQISGNHFLGGIVGNNYGVVRRGINSALINAVVEQNSVGISDITIESLMGSESVVTVTDIGGIAGNSSGVLKNCANYNQVGYRQMGYNVGGIVGRQAGYVVDCMNYGDVYGRKEVGGIVGHQEPNVLLLYEVDTLQTLEGQLGTMQTLTNRTASNAQSGVNQLNGQINIMNEQAKSAEEAANGIRRMYEEGEFDLDTMIAYQNNLGESLKGMTSTMQNIANTTKNTAYTLNRNIQSINSQMNAITNTLNNAEEGLGGEWKDVSDEDTEELTSSEVYSSDNYGQVSGELNVGGIVGLISLETDLDAQEDVDILGEASMHFISEMRSVVLNNKNWGIIYVKKQCGGGIVGRQDLGLVKECTNVGTVDGTGADYVGGIVGRSLSYIRNCNAKSRLLGLDNVGGIAGSGVIASDCLSMVEIQGGMEKNGSVFGGTEKRIQQEENAIARNYYVTTGERDYGAIDGISYAGYAEPMNRESFMSRENLPIVFTVVTVSFWADNREVESITLPVGNSLKMEQIPAVPEKENAVGEWDGLKDANLENIVFDLYFEAEYRSNSPTLESRNKVNGLPVILVLGEFLPDSSLAVSKLQDVSLPEAGVLLEAWEYAIEGEGEVTEVRFLRPEAAKQPERLWIRNSLGVWREGDYGEDGSYLVFAVEGEDTAFVFTQTSDGLSRKMAWIAAGCGVACLFAVTVVLAVRMKRVRKNKNEQKSTES